MLNRASAILAWIELLGTTAHTIYVTLLLLLNGITQNVDSAIAGRT